ncbi:MAG TPA: pyroglutamyl-peptidase I [Pseudolabrys sp.]|nr:pyroglutamyl-peptidase I [Pseudolabrys sp.]
MAATILVTGFGPFPGAPHNPTEALVKRLGREPAPRGTRVATHVFRTSYAAVDREFPALLRRHRPDALLMFGLATKAPRLRVEMCARNILAPLADADGIVPDMRPIAPGRQAALRLATPARQLLAAASAAHVKAALSSDAGGYLCNYLCWRAAMAARLPHGPHLAAFIHVPAGQNPADLARAGRRCLATVARLV